MNAKNTKLESASRRAAAIIEEHLETLSPAAAKAMRKDIHALAVKSSRPAGRGRTSRVRSLAIRATP